MEQEPKSIGFFMKSDKTEVVFFKQDERSFTLNDKLLEFVNHFTYLGRKIVSTERDVSLRIRTWTAID